MKAHAGIRQFRSGLSAYKRSVPFLRQENLRHWYIVIGLAAAGCMFLVGIALDAMANWLEESIIGPFHDQIGDVIGAWGDSDWQWVIGGFEGVVSGIVFLAKLWLQFKVAKFIVLIALSPFFAVFAQVFYDRTAPSHAFVENERNGWWSAWRGIKSAVLLVAMEMIIGAVLSLVFLFVSLIMPAVSFVSWWFFPVFAGAVSIWFYGAALLDYVWEQKGLNARASLVASWEQKGVALALGIPFYLFMTVPFLGWLVGPLYGGMVGIVAAFLWSWKRKED